MAQFLLLLHEQPDGFGTMSAEQIQAVVGEYMAWRESLVERDLLVDGQKLKDEGGRHLSLNDGQLQVIDGPYSEVKEVLGGFFMINADNYDAAVQISQDCPHLKFGGRIELREVDEVHD